MRTDTTTAIDVRDPHRVNGAGKTSVLEVIDGLAAPSEGSVRVLGLDPVAGRAEVRRRCGALLQRSGSRVT